MKFTAISDLHGHLPKDLPGGDALCGHVHTGNHFPESFESVRNVVNVSIKDENYKVAYKPFNFEI